LAKKHNTWLILAFHYAFVSAEGDFIVIAMSFADTTNDPITGLTVPKKTN
jgi:hypothetical protein